MRSHASASIQAADSPTPSQRVQITAVPEKEEEPKVRSFCNLNGEGTFGSIIIQAVAHAKDYEPS